MDKEVLEGKLKALEGQFETLNKEKANHEKQAQDIEAELFRLQGDYRTLQNLLSEAIASEAKPTTDPVTTITAKPKKEEANATTDGQ